MSSSLIDNQSYNSMISESNGKLRLLTNTGRPVGGEFIALVTGAEVAALGVRALAVLTAVPILCTFINVYKTQNTGPNAYEIVLLNTFMHKIFIFKALIFLVINDVTRASKPFTLYRTFWWQNLTFL